MHVYMRMYMTHGRKECPRLIRISILFVFYGNLKFYGVCEVLWSV